jgi:outer membrane protein OmpA-like peptidoglycan-associated protein
MDDARKIHYISRVSEDQTHNNDNTPTAAPVSVAPKSAISATLVLSVVVALLVGFMISMNLNQKKKVDQTDLYAAQAELASRTATVNAERARQGLPPLEGVGTDSPEQIAARLTKDAATLANFSDRFRSLLTEKDTIIADKNANLLVSEQARQALSSQLGKLQNQLEKALAEGAGSESLRAQLNEARNNATMMQERLASYANRPTQEDMAMAKARIAELEAQLATKNAVPPPPAPRKLFADSVNELYPMAHGLFQGLNELEDKADLEISAAYNRFATQYRASFLKEIRFPTGSSQLNPADKLALGDALNNMPEGAMILVVGYASTTGVADSNRQLSSDRATAVASNVEMAKPGNQVVQAVFLGQTKRFSSRIPERNQVCEVWQINPQ